MLDAKFIRENAELVRAGAVKKHVACDVDGFLAADAERRRIGPRVDELRSQQKSAGKSIAQASAEERPALLEAQKAVKAELKALEEELSASEARMRALQLEIPNVPDEAVPEGKDDAENVELRRVGELPAFGFELKDHIDLSTAQGE